VGSTKMHFISQAQVSYSIRFVEDFT